MIEAQGLTNLRVPLLCQGCRAKIMVKIESVSLLVIPRTIIFLRASDFPASLFHFAHISMGVNDSIPLPLVDQLLYSPKITPYRALP